MMNKRWFLPVVLQMFLLIAPLAMAGQLAIVIDDVGYRQKEDNAVYALPKAVSVSIIPVSPYATARAKQAFAQQRDVMIHLPMQPQNNVAIEAGALRVGMSLAEIEQQVREARNAVPYAIGLNNHMGSLATSDRPTMEKLMSVLSAQQLFFLDSKTSGKSVASQVAKEKGIATLDRHFFLDDSNELADVQRQYQASLAYARKHGLAIVIGHPRPNTLAVLQQGLANLPKDIELVNVGRLWRKEKITPEKPFILIFSNEPAPTSVVPYQVIPLLRGIPQD